VEASGTATVKFQLWYADYPRSDFHFINDNRGRKMDKAGHIFPLYLGRFGAEMNGVELKESN
jgi:hypothetical protein